MSYEVDFPAGEPQALVIAASGDNAVTINLATVVKSITTLTGNGTLTVTKGSELKIGTGLLVIVKTTATETFTFAGDIVAPVVTGVAGKTWSQEFVFNGTKYYPSGPKIQVD